jgi:DNA mismatch repair ATPase MutS
MFVTHFAQLVEYLKCHPKVSLIQLQTQLSEISNELRFVYRATNGTVSVTNYGIRMADSIGLDPSLLAFARRSLQLLESSEGMGLEHAGVRNSLQRRKSVLQIAERISKVKETANIDDEARQIQLKNLVQTLSEESL